jgi:ABC-type transport system substrate-binding protein
MRRIGLAVVLAGSLVLAPAAFFWAGRALDAQPAREQPRFGGVLKVATNGEPPSLDPHWSPSVVTSRPMWHVFETLFTFDGDYKPIPLLAEGHALADGGRRYTIALRKGVRFHNGKELTAADVVASLNRWGAMLGRSLWKSVESVDATGSYEIVIRLKEPTEDLVPGSPLALAEPPSIRRKSSTRPATGRSSNSSAPGHSGSSNTDRTVT